MATLTDQGALLRAVLQEPGDDLHRLAYADWCEERGDALRAEFIRVQIKLARLPHHLDACDQQRKLLLMAREADLLSLASQSRGFNDWAPGYVQSWRWRRGFVEEVKLAHRDFAHGDRARWLFSTWPIRRVVLPDRSPWHDGSGRWCWVPAAPTVSYDNDPSRLRPALLAAIVGAEGAASVHDSEEGAVEALEAGAVRWGRSLSGLFS